MSALDALIRREIETSGPMLVSRYMQLCLTHPEHGYYTCKDPLGADGDFTTAPEISQLFGEMVAVWLVATWQQLGCPAPFALIELGPGRGTLMADVLRSTRQAPEFHQALQLHLVETSSGLRARQLDALKPYGFEPTYHDELGSLPHTTSFFLANEFLDALPSNQWVRTENGWNARKLGLGQASDLTFGVDLTPLPAPKPVQEDVPHGTIIEHSPAQDRLVTQISEHISHYGGAALLFDYGSEVSGYGDTLQAVRRHKSVSPLEAAGEVDLTTHVDFAHLSRIARENGAATADITEQGSFLLEVGLLQRAGALGATADEKAREAISLAVERLAGDAGMGRLFKVLALSSQTQSLPGFARNRPDHSE